LSFAVNARTAIFVATGLSLLVWAAPSPMRAADVATFSWKGHTLDDWVEIYGEYRYTTNPWASPPEIDEAIRHFGASAMPFLLQRISAEQPESSLDSSPKDRRESYQAIGAVAAFRILGTNAKAAIPELEKIARAPKDREVEYRDPAWGLDYYSTRNRRAIFALGNIGAPAEASLLEFAAHGSADCRADSIYFLGEFGTNAASAIPLLIDALAECTNHVAINAARALGRLKQKPDLVVPALTSALNERLDLLTSANIDPLEMRLALQYQIFQALVSYGAEARSALPAIIGWLDSNDPRVPEYAADALGKLRIEPDLTVPALTNALESPNPYLVRSAAHALGTFGSAAKSAIPTLGQLAGRTNLMGPTRHAVNESLRIITTAN
jgi:HEAT repeat protein